MFLPLQRIVPHCGTFARRGAMAFGLHLLLLVVPGCTPTSGPRVPENENSSPTAGNENSSNASNSNAPSDGNDNAGTPSTNGNANDNAAPPSTGTTRYFPDDAPWYTDISAAALDPESAEVIDWLASNGGWGGGRMQIDFSITVLQADEPATPRAFTPTDDWFSPDCDLGEVPVPAAGALEGETGYACESDGDCHLLIVDRSNMLLYEMWRADIRGNEFLGGCLAVWSMSRTYPTSGRGENCTSADAAGYPIAPLLFTPEEVAVGEVDHAIRFILPNARICGGVYLHPATHSTSAASGGDAAPPYGTRLRLRADFPLDTLPNDGARSVARAMQRYGMYLADGGTIALTAASDLFSAQKWNGLLGPHDLVLLQVSDFEMVDGGERIPYVGDCRRN